MINVFSLSVENSNGERLNLTHNHKFYDVISIDGLSPPSATINTIDIAGSDGTLFNNSKLQRRNIVIMINIKHPIEENRLKLYRFFRIKQWIKIYYKNRSRNVYTEGYVESFENNLFERYQRPQISIICPNPYWKNCTESTFELSNIVPMFEFPFKIDSSGTEMSTISNGSRANVFINGVATGGLIKIVANEDLHYLIITNSTTGERFIILTDILSGDEIIINTNFGEKSAKLIRDNVETNLLNEKYVASKWIQFIPGSNEIICTSSSGYVNVSGTITVVQKYEGV